ncbi:hypothetical protein Back11_05070 [Paenibacillus baekrokdamisoli]|uniref:Uncharacterized protein n=1 Tax=Paenibacillus baekrokdamisoli TaxID=1712516 RepID=A0A3G9ILS3_9BACL|nr:DUF1003 domain-containing protein [Paenibacillus baekrokdamisoli]MBB3067651.1 putative membrane protein [Paenibacillus baekrokdamisoli]BBH19162.1 hypothetical protein Back11_05070 [Paenibacillus baekrokdamisoli]
MAKRNYFQWKKEFADASKIQGFDIELNQESTKRIDRLVNHYEKSILSHLDEEYLRKTSWSDRIADRMAYFGGSWRFIIYFAIFLVVWITWNEVPFTPFHFDNAPFILLNLCLSFVAAFQAPVIMMSQNRQAARDKHESIIDFAINYKAEQEIDDMQSHLHRIESELLEVKKLLLAFSPQNNNPED